MKLPTSTSFVMAATLALQSSALAVPDSPVVGHASPHSARSATDAQFAGPAPEIGSPSPAPSRSTMMKGITLPGLVSAGELTNALQGTVDGTLAVLDLRADKDEDISVSAAQSNGPSFGKRQGEVAMAPPGAPASAGSETNGPNQAINSVQPQSKPSPQASGVNNKLPQKREPQLPAPPAPYPQIPNAAGGFTLTNDAPVPGSVAGFPVQVSGGTPASGAIGNVVGSGQYPESIVGGGGVTGGIPVVSSVVGSAVNQLPNAQGVAGQTPGNTPFRGVAGSLFPGNQKRVEATNRQPEMGAQGIVPNGEAPFSLQGQAGPPDAADEGAGNGSASPSSITATPSSSPACTSPTNQAPQSTTDSSSAGATPVMDIEFAPSVSAPAPNAPTSGLPAPGGVSVPSLPVQPPGSLPISPPASAPTSLPVSAPAPPVAPRSIAQVFRDAGEPEHVPPSAPVKPPVSTPSSAPVSAPVHPSASASAPVPAPTQNAPKPPMFMRAKRALMGREPQMPAPLSNDLALPSGFPAPSLPIPGDVPPLLQSSIPTAVPATKDAMDTHSSLSHPVSNTETFTSYTSSDYSPASTASTKGKMTPSKSTWRRRRFFRFNRD